MPTGCNVNIEHFAPNDLEIWLISPQGVATMLFSSLLPLPPNLSQNFHTQYFNGTKAQGQWIVLVRDLVPALEGTLKQANLSISYEGYLILKSTTTNASGNYTLTGLESGLYQVVPSQTGKVFSPGSKFLELGPSQTGINFKRTN
jgi:subtilisin-like proprotein convertase family protein